MASDYLFSVGTVGKSTRNGRKPSTLLAAASHNLRTIQAELGAMGHIDPLRTALNETLVGPSTPQGVVGLALSMLADAGVEVAQLRKDYTQAVELLFSLPASAAIDDGKFFRRCVEWTGERFGLVNILSAVIHRDESTPHCHVLVSPLVSGEVRGSALVGHAATAALRESFYRDVANPFGLEKPVDRMKGVDKASAVRAVLDRLQSTQDAIFRSALWVTTKRDIERNPAPFVAALGIELQPATQKPMRTMAKIFTSTGKGPKVEPKPIGFESASQKPIGFENYAKNHRNLSCVGFGKPTPPLSAQSAPPKAPPAPSPDRMAIAQQAMQTALAKHTQPRNTSPTPTKLESACDTVTRVPDAEPLPDDW
jgi:hypothetical protein